MRFGRLLAPALPFMDSLVVFSPAKTNFFLAVTGRRPDGFHDLVSVVAPLTFGDTIRLQRLRGRDRLNLTCSDPEVPTGPENLAARAVAAFREATGIRDSVAVDIAKRIPIGAGLGGGSSNAVAVLRGLNLLHGEPLAADVLAATAAKLGSDCPLFLVGGVCVMRGRGEQITTLTPPARHRFARARLLLFKPQFGVSTPWAYGQLAASAPASYLPAHEAERRIEAWFAQHQRPVAELLFNSFEAVVYRKFVALGLLVEQLRATAGVEGVLLSGSGSASFVLLAPGAEAALVAAHVRDTLGPETFVQETAVG